MTPLVGRVQQAAGVLQRSLYGQTGPAVLSSVARSFASEAESNGIPVEVHNEGGSKRVVVTKQLPGSRWLDLLTKADCRVEVSTHPEVIASKDTIKKLIGSQCDGVLGQLTEDWGSELFSAMQKAGGHSYSNYAVGFNNVDVKAATENKVSVGNTPGVLTETTAELAVALTMAAARRIVEADRFMREGKYEGWLPTLFVGALLQNKTLGIIGAGRIGAAYARMMSEGHKMDIVYYDPYPNKNLEDYMKGYGELLKSKGERPVTCTRVETMEEVFKAGDVVSLHCALDDKTKHLADKKMLGMMKEDAILINAARGPIHHEDDLVAHLKANPNFRCGLDVFEDEPHMKPGLAECDNAVIVPHIASASQWTRSGMATLAAANIAGRLQGFPVWDKPDMLPFVDGPFDEIPKASPSILNAKELGI